MNSEQYSGHNVFHSILRDDLTGVQNVLKSFPSALEHMDRFSNTPLLYACYCGRSDLVSYLLVMGANYNRLNIYGKNKQTQTKRKLWQKFSMQWCGIHCCCFNFKVKMRWHWLHIRVTSRHAMRFWAVSILMHSMRPAYCHHCVWLHSKGTPIWHKFT